MRRWILALPLLLLGTLCIANGLLVAQEGFLSFLTPGRTKIANNLKQLGLAMHNYHDTFKSFPPTGLEYPQPKAGKLDPKAKPKQMLSWRVRILPFIEQIALYEKFNFNEPWDGPTNKPLLDQMPKVFQSPGAKIKPNETLFQVVTMSADGEKFLAQAREAMPKLQPATAFDQIINGGRLPGFPNLGIRRIVDGTSRSLMIVEVDADRAVPWTKPDDLAFEFDKPWAGLGTLRKDGFNFVLCDGAVGSFDKKTVSDAMLREALLINDLSNTPGFYEAIKRVRY